MTVTSVEKDPVACTMRISAEFTAPVDRVWQLWADPRLLERWWGPPTYPATFDDFDLAVGSDVSYRMTGPEGEVSRGWWKVLVVEEPSLIELEDGFADESGAHNDAMPSMRMRVEIGESGSVTTMSITTTFPSAEDMERMVEMGMEEGMSLAMGQIDGILEEQATSA